mgnify:FL=1
MNKIYFFRNVDNKNEYLCVLSDNKQIDLIDPVELRNEVLYILHSTGIDRAQSWLEWFKKGAHADTSKELLSELPTLNLEIATFGAENNE